MELIVLLAAIGLKCQLEATRHCERGGYIVFFFCIMCDWFFSSSHEHEGRLGGHQIDVQMGRG